MERKPKPTDKPLDLGPRPSRSRQIVEIRKSEVWVGVTYQLVRKKRYNSKGAVYSKNPYWYAYWRDSEIGRTRCKYIGRDFRELSEGDFG